MACCVSRAGASSRPQTHGRLVLPREWAPSRGSMRGRVLIRPRPPPTSSTGSHRPGLHLHVRPTGRAPARTPAGHRRSCRHRELSTCHGWSHGRGWLGSPSSTWNSGETRPRALGAPHPVSGLSVRAPSGVPRLRAPGGPAGTGLHLPAPRGLPRVRLACQAAGSDLRWAGARLQARPQPAQTPLSKEGLTADGFGRGFSGLRGPVCLAVLSRRSGWAFRWELASQA